MWLIRSKEILLNFLPQEAMIEIEFLENMNGRFFFYKGNMVGKST